jgi:hypothetical protein
MLGSSLGSPNPGGRQGVKSEEIPLMSIAHELSCDVATAMLAARESEQPDTHDGDLTDVVLKVHSTLRCLTGEARRNGLNRKLFPPQRKAVISGVGNAASGNH